MRIVALDHRLRAGELSGAGNARRAWRRRRSSLVALTDDRSRQGVGEASPLAGFGSDDLEAADRDLDRWRAGLPRELDPQAPLDRLAEMLAPVASRSARCALETALLDLIGQRRGEPIWSLLGARAADGAPARVPLAGLITTDDPQRARAQAGRLADRGISVAKLKIGRPGRFEQELATAAAVRDAGVADLRFDANGCLPPADLERDLAKLADLAPELIEEPAAAVRLLALPSLPAGAPLALDESLLGDDAPELVERMAAAGRLVAVVLKPMAVGGVLPALALAKRAAARGVGALASHLYDGPIAWQAAAHLALALPGPRWAAGLDRHPGLDAWPPSDLPLLAGPRIAADDRPGLGLTSGGLT